jgi:hypothetical protein
MNKEANLSTVNVPKTPTPLQSSIEKRGIRKVNLGREMKKDLSEKPSNRSLLNLETVNERTPIHPKNLPGFILKSPLGIVKERGSML